ncbi:uncharacterized protein AMSG_05336 [Thecamonas trahens ATCC 50062]|uniref:EF-hand domain-containing protein n=1 Tax=Thecamonas trahens ATCC 50062 TaxID=461836 RepID=A0A0L0DAG6_THETB|nr:hypothetical protein AMSG_05336 [Thecamonas trahens ATCC 50062]KNC49337.1 hypothetical protein AMSG_05336 [Thecamonas trahens ATCC 50062]|eukprot:XP_013758045.1 hypothetical protein AMSG_05336 [Thecamonas trahens ATCC 50062]
MPGPSLADQVMSMYSHSSGRHLADADLVASLSATLAAGADVSHLELGAGSGSGGGRGKGGKANRGGSVGNGLPASKIPKSDYVVTSSPLPGKGPDSVYSAADGLWHTTVFPRAVPSSRRDVDLLNEWIEAKTSQLAAEADDPLKLIAATNSIYSIAIHEVTRQVTVQCAPRGKLLTKLFRKYVALFQRILKLVQRDKSGEDVEAQRALTDQLQTQRIKYNDIIDALRLEFDHAVRDVLAQKKELESQNATLTGKLQHAEQRIERFSIGRVAAEAKIEELTDQCAQQSRALDRLLAENRQLRRSAAASEAAAVAAVASAPGALDRAYSFGTQTPSAWWTTSLGELSAALSGKSKSTTATRAAAEIENIVAARVATELDRRRHDADAHLADRATQTDGSLFAVAESARQAAARSAVAASVQTEPVAFRESYDSDESEFDSTVPMVGLREFYHELNADTLLNPTVWAVIEERTNRELETRAAPQHAPPQHWSGAVAEVSIEVPTAVVATEAAAAACSASESASAISADGSTKSGSGSESAAELRTGSASDSSSASSASSASSTASSAASSAASSSLDMTEFKAKLASASSAAIAAVGVKVSDSEVSPAASPTTVSAAAGPAPPPPLPHLPSFWAQPDSAVKDIDTTLAAIVEPTHVPLVAGSVPGVDVPLSPSSPLAPSPTSLPVRPPSGLGVVSSGGSEAAKVLNRARDILMSVLTVADDPLLQSMATSDMTSLDKFERVLNRMAVRLEAITNEHKAFRTMQELLLQRASGAGSKQGIPMAQRAPMLSETRRTSSSDKLRSAANSIIAANRLRAFSTQGAERRSQRSRSHSFSQFMPSASSRRIFDKPAAALEGMPAMDEVAEASLKERSGSKSESGSGSMSGSESASKCGSETGDDDDMETSDTESAVARDDEALMQSLPSASSTLLSESGSLNRSFSIAGAMTPSEQIVRNQLSKANARLRAMEQQVRILRKALLSARAKLRAAGLEAAAEKATAAARRGGVSASELAAEPPTDVALKVKSEIDSDIKALLRSRGLLGRLPESGSDDDDGDELVCMVAVATQTEGVGTAVAATQTAGDGVTLTVSMQAARGLPVQASADNMLLALRSRLKDQIEQLAQTQQRLVRTASSASMQRSDSASMRRSDSMSVASRESPPLDGQSLAAAAAISASTPHVVAPFASRSLPHTPRRSTLDSETALAVKVLELEDRLREQTEAHRAELAQATAAAQHGPRPPTGEAPSAPAAVRAVRERALRSRREAARGASETSEVRAAAVKLAAASTEGGSGLEEGADEVPIAARGMRNSVSEAMMAVGGGVGSSHAVLPPIGAVGRTGELGLRSGGAQSLVITTAGGGSGVLRVARSVERLAGTRGTSGGGSGSRSRSRSLTRSRSGSHSRSPSQEGTSSEQAGELSPSTMVSAMRNRLTSTVQLDTKTGRAPRPKPLRWVLQRVWQLYSDKMSADSSDDRVGMPHIPFQIFVYEWFVHEYGLRSLAEANLKALLHTVSVRADGSPRMAMFARFCGLACADQVYSLDVLDVFLATLRQVVGHAGVTLEAEPVRVGVTAALDGVHKALSAERGIAAAQLEKAMAQLAAVLIREAEGVDGEQIVDVDTVLGETVGVWLQVFDPTYARMQALYRAADMNGDGELDCQEFVHTVLHAAPSFSAAEARALFVAQAGSEEATMAPGGFVAAAQAGHLPSWQPGGDMRGTDLVERLERLWGSTREAVMDEIEVLNRKLAGTSEVDLATERLSNFVRLYSEEARDVLATWYAYHLLMLDLALAREVFRASLPSPGERLHLGRRT